VKAGVKALYAVPLVFGDDLIGVAKMGSRTASEFSQDDRQLFQQMAQRAAVGIARRGLAEEREVFLGIVSHDLRTPLNTIVMGAAHLRKREKLSDAGERAVEGIGSASQRMDNMIAGLADYTKIRFGGGLQTDPHVIDLGNTVRELVGELVGQHPDRPIQLDVKGDVVGEWDRVRLGQVMSNLVNNALNYGEPSTPITITVDGSEEAAVTLAVHNQRPPIPQGLRPHLFDAFRRGWTERHGMGLGLYVVQHVAHAHGGCVDVDSSAERGTTFTVRLPRWAAGQRR
jgi:signal transduction histidine kinase